jgi:GT2 family glycosyltransferase
VRIAVVVATTSRSDEVGALLNRLDRQSRKPDRVIISAHAESDLPPGAHARAEVALGPKGLTTQRNRGIELILPDCDIVVFFDDDYLPSLNCIAGVERVFADHPRSVGARGHLLADGTSTAGVSSEEAERLLDEFDSGAQPEVWAELSRRGLYATYGCNMAFQVNAIGDTRFDEALPLYGLCEDLDFGARLMNRGPLLLTNSFVGVHRGVKGGRTRGMQLGYSQIANPIYLMGKGTMPKKHGLPMMARQVSMNHLKLLSPEPWIDRAGRAKGNWIAFRDLLFGRLKPTRILNMK